MFDTTRRTLHPRNVKNVLSTKKHNFQEAIKSKHAFAMYLRTPGAMNDPDSKWSWVNEDLLPTPREKWSWGYINYFNLYFSWSMDNWTLGSTMIGIGLNWWQAILVIFGSQCISSIFQAINSRSGATYHVGYPIVARSVFGMYGAYYVVFARAVMACVYYAIKLYIGSSFVVNMLTAVFGTHFTSIPNHLPLSTGFTTQQMLAFFLYWLIHIPFTLLRPNQLAWVFTLKMCTIPPAYIGLFIFCMVNTHAQMGHALPMAASASKAQFSWFIMYAINSGIGNTANTITNQPDYSRWSKTKWAVIIPQVIANPLSVTISSTFGILATSAINNKWGLQLWNQWDLLAEIMTRYPRSDVRFAVFLCAAAQALLVLGTNVAANMIPFGSDSAMMLPRYINMTRGQFLGLCLAWVVNPWKILYSAEAFTNFLSGYGLFMAAVVGPMVADYYFVTRGNMAVEYLYDGTKANTRYYYIKGFNLRGFVAYIAGIAFPFAGFCGTLGATVSQTATKLGYIGWLLSFAVSFAVYWASCIIFPTPMQKKVREEGLKWEELSYREYEIDFGGGERFRKSVADSLNNKSGVVEVVSVDSNLDGHASDEIVEERLAKLE